MKFSILVILLALVGCNSKSGSVKDGSAYAEIPAPAPGPDPLAVYQWHLDDIPGSYLNGALPLTGQNINLGDTHDHYTGDGVYVVVSDGRIDLNHPELSRNANLSLSKNYLTSYPYFGSPTTSDNTDGHGTGTSSLIVAEKGNGLGGFGVAPDATLVGSNFISSSQSTSILMDQATLTGHKGIFNYSYGIPNCGFQSYQSNYIQTLQNGVVDKGHIYVTSAGNDYKGSLKDCGYGPYIYLGNANLDQIKSYPSMIVVGATNRMGKHTSYSTPGSNVWVVAPGGDSDMGILVADLVGCNKGYNRMSPLPFDNTSTTLNPYCEFFSGAMGTSYSSPITTGAIALLREVNPNLDWRDVKHILAKTAVKVDASATSTSHPYGQNLSSHTYQQGWVTNNASYAFHPWYGFGQINVEAAVALAENPNFDLFEMKTTNNFTDEMLYTSGPISVSIPDNSATGNSHVINVDAHNLLIEHVQVKVSITHEYPMDLGIELTSPSGTVTKLMNINSGIIDENLSNVTFGANAFYGERSSGNWTLKVVDGAAADVGTLTKWSLAITGNRGPASVDTTSPDPVTNFTRSSGTLSWTASGSSDVARYEICLAVTSQLGTSCIEGDWRSVKKDDTSLTLSGRIYRGQPASMVTGTNYTARIRAVDTSENVSSEVTVQWTH